MKNLLLATGNTHKTQEIQKILGSEVSVLDLRSLPNVGDIIEDSDTFEGNANIKSVTVSQLTSEIVLADDSGLCVDALSGAPGIRSARYAGENATMEQNKKLLLSELSGRENRKAAFVCVLSVAMQGEVITTFRGECVGRIIDDERGAGGFGYDPLFIPEGYDKTFSELPEEVKNQISHRAVAMKQFQRWLKSQS